MTGLPAIRYVFTMLGAGGAAVLMGLSGCAATGGSAGHVESSAAARGLSYARDACASCHAVELGEFESPEVSAPSFEALANRPDMTRSSLAALLRSPHRNMPNLIVEPERIDDLAAYLVTLGET